MTRVAVFVDYQNVYQGAREAFRWQHEHYTLGQVHPRQLGVMLVALGRPVDADRELEFVQVFRGEPSAKHSRAGQAACQRQVEHWNGQAKVDAVTRPLQYQLMGTTDGGDAMFLPREKGIDVLIALAMVMGARNDKYDTAILMSGDTDLTPAVEAVLDLGKRCEVAAWQGRDRRRGRIAVSGRPLWCHWLDERAYNLVCDPTDYAKPLPGPATTSSAGPRPS